MKVLIWDAQLDIIPNVARADVGTTSDVALGISEVSDPGEIILYDKDDRVIHRVSEYETINDVSELVRINGTLTKPWGTPRAFERMDLYTANIETHQAMYTNSQGQFVFYGVIGECIKVKIKNEFETMWFAVPDKPQGINWTDIDGTYGYKVDELKNDKF